MKPISKSIVMFSGYIALGLVIIGLILCRLKKKKRERLEAPSPCKVASVDDIVDTKPSFTSTDFKTDVSKSDYSIYSTESAFVPSSLVVLTSPIISDLKFEDLLSAPAELLGRGKHGTLYRVIFENGMVLAVKRIKGWMISTDEFKHRMQRLDQAKHLNVLPALAFYCSIHEKLLVYEYQPNGSLFSLLHGKQPRRKFEWASRLKIAAKIAEALAYMHRELYVDGIPHGNLKSTNILLKNNMEPCISEYGLMVMDPQDPSSSLNGLNSMQQQTKSSSTMASERDTKKGTSELLSSAKLVADAAKSTFNKESDKVDKGKVAGAGADLLGAAQHYGKLDKDKGVGQYVEKAETYLHQYQTSHLAPTTNPDSHGAGAAAKDSETAAAGGGGVGDYMKMAQGFLGK